MTSTPTFIMLKASLPTVGNFISSDSYKSAILCIGYIYRPMILRV